MKWLKVEAWIRPFALTILILGFSGAIARFSYLAWAYGTDFMFTVAGDVARNTSGLFAVAAASVAAWIAFKTNQTRAEEAARSHFKDRLQWAVERSRSSNDLEGLLAEKFIESARSNALYSSEDLEIAQSIAQRQAHLREIQRFHASQYEKIVSDSLSMIWNQYKDLELDDADEASLQALQLEFRELKLELSDYNRDIIYMRMADKIQKIVDIYRKSASDGGGAL